jgi:hypothetical protein
VTADRNGWQRRSRTDQPVGILLGPVAAARERSRELPAGFGECDVGNVILFGEFCQGTVQTRSYRSSLL